MDRVDYQSLIIQDLLNDYRDEKLNLNPWYQRRSVWTPSQKSYLINTLFERKPIPALYVRHTIDLEKQKSLKEVVDGQQRSRAIIDYCAGKFSARVSGVGRKNFNELTNDLRERLLLTPLPIGYLLGASDADVIDIFARINSISKTLNSQEKRNAQFGGEFKQFCLDIATSTLPFWRSTGVFSANDISRMNEVLFVSDVIVNMMEGLVDYRPMLIDAVYKSNEDDFPRESEMRDRWNRVFDALLEINPQVIKDTIFSRQPLFFSLVICLDSKGKFNSDKLEDQLYSIDAEFRDESKNSQDLISFRDAMKASTQRLQSRTIRQEFLNSRL